MQQNPLVTVICLCYNHAPFLVKSLNSVMQQVYKNIEIIIVDDHSTDNSRSVIEQWLTENPEAVFITNKTNLGNTKSFNIALKLAKGEYIIDLATDDILLPDCIEKQLHQFRISKYQNLGLVYGNAELISEDGVFIENYFATNQERNVIQKRNTGNIYESVLVGGDSICSVSAMTKKSVLQELNGYDENLAYEDLDIWIRISRNHTIDFIDSELMQKRVTKTSLSNQFYSNNYKINYSTYLIFKKALQLNRTKTEDIALQKRIHYELIHLFKTRNWKLFLKNLWLRIRIELRKWF